MTRFSAERRVIFWEEPIPGLPGEAARLNSRTCPDSGVIVVTPVLPDGDSAVERDGLLRGLLVGFLAGCEDDLIFWYYTPMMLNFSRHLRAICTIYDCMDELANFKFAPPELTILERELMSLADVVFTGGYSLWEAKRDRHPNIHPFPSSV
ncbi:MAG TPA: UDP-galactopyranose mutase, partial [Phenylobacterium sp.]|nr:UDP-galactopyranose mutase [Phenylobacterium sp.]